MHCFGGEPDGRRALLVPSSGGPIRPDVSWAPVFWAAENERGQSLFEQGPSGHRLSSERDLHVLTSTPIVTALFG
jgi:hypothetical protein